MKPMLLSIGQLAAASLFTFMTAGCSDNDNKGGAVQEPLADTKTYYTNPVIGPDTPDPTVIKADDGYFYLYNTGGNCYFDRSKDLVNWEFLGTAFTEEDKPAWEPDAGIWAPDINYINGKYVLYYAMSKWGGGATCGIGVAVADTPTGPFTDLGKLFRSNEIDVHNSIDPFYIEDNGKKYLFWGSWWGIWGVELTEDGLALAGGIEQAKANKFQVAWGSEGTDSYEAPYILKRGDYYYLFCSTGTCCDGLNSTYTTVVARSTSLFGPYVNAEGKSMLEGRNHEVVILKNEDFVGTGHNAEIVQDDAGNDWIIYHAYVAGVDQGRVICLDRLYWDEDGWPYVLGNGPAVKAEAPVFNNK